MRPGNHWIAYVIVAATALVVQAQAPTLRFAGVDIHGTEQDRAELLRGMHVHDISQLHDQKALRGPAFASTDPALRTPIPIVDMIFSQPLRRV